MLPANCLLLQPPRESIVGLNIDALHISSEVGTGRRFRFSVPSPLLPSSTSTISSGRTGVEDDAHLQNNGSRLGTFAIQRHDDADLFTSKHLIAPPHLGDALTLRSTRIHAEKERNWTPAKLFVSPNGSD
jgi:hypothetical protein